MNRVVKCLVFLVTAVLAACQPGGGSEGLPFLGRMEIAGSDTVYHTIADFELTDQDSNRFTQKNLQGKIYVSDFFFTSCPDICPMMKTQMLRIYEAYADSEDILFVSHTIDPDHDTPAVLKDFSERMEVDNNRWIFLTGDIDYIYKLGQTSYMASMANDPRQGFVHSGRFFLIDKQRRVRGAYDGTDAEAVDKLISDIQKLKREYE